MRAHYAANAALPMRQPASRSGLRQPTRVATRRVQHATPNERHIRSAAEVQQKCSKTRSSVRAGSHESPNRQVANALHPMPHQKCGNPHLSEVHWEAMSLSTGGCTQCHTRKKTLKTPHLGEVHGEAVGVPQREGIAARQLAVLGACRGGVGRGSSSMVGRGSHMKMGGWQGCAAQVGWAERESSMVGRWKRPTSLLGRPNGQPTTAFAGGPLVELLLYPGAQPCIPITMHHSTRFRTQHRLTGSHLVELLQALHQGAGEGGLLIRNDLPATHTTKMCHKRLH